jgi:hypothetical protein
LLATEIIASPEACAITGTIDPSVAYVDTGFVPAAEYTYSDGHTMHQSYLFAIELAHPLPYGCFLPYKFPNCTKLTVPAPSVVGIVAFHVLPETYVHDPPTNGIADAAVITGAGPIPYASNVIGFALVPDDGGISGSFHTSPRFK